MTSAELIIMARGDQNVAHESTSDDQIVAAVQEELR